MQLKKWLLLEEKILLNQKKQRIYTQQGTYTQYLPLGLSQYKITQLNGKGGHTIIAPLGILGCGILEILRL